MKEKEGINKEENDINKSSQLAHIWYRMTRCKPIEKSVQQSQGRRTLLWYHLLAYGVSATVGGGIYVVVGELAAKTAGPAVIFSILLTGVLSLLTAFCYLELASLIPSTGSSYVYGYSFLGEFMGFILGWISTLEYGFAASITAVFWARNLVKCIEHTGVGVPLFLYKIPDTEIPYMPFEINLIAFLLIGCVMLVAILGVEFGAKFNAVLTSFNLVVIIGIIIVGGALVDPGLYDPFFPYPGLGILHAAATMMYCYIGFDTICNLSSDAKSNRHLQIGVVGTVGIATGLYLAVGLVLTGMVPLGLIDMDTSLASAFDYQDASWAGYLVRVCSLSMMIATLLACLIGQPRLFQIMSQDGFLPAIFHKVNKAHIPRYNIFICCILSAVIALSIKINELVDLVSLGALTGFALNACGLILHRLRRHPEALSWGGPFLLCLFLGNMVSWPFLHNGHTLLFLIFSILTILIPFGALCYVFYKYRGPMSLGIQQQTLCPWMPLIPCLVLIGNSSVIFTLSSSTFIQFSVWIGIGILVYAFYGYRHSKIDDEFIIKARENDSTVLPYEGSKLLEIHSA